MRNFLPLLILFIGISTTQSQIDLTGTWEGMIYRNGQRSDQGQTFLLSFSKEGERIEGTSREEINETEFYGIGKFYGTQKDSSLELKHVVYTEKKGSIRTTWCKMELNLSYNGKTGYLEGEFSSVDCRQNNGKMILYRINPKATNLSELKNTSSISQKLIVDISKGRNAPEIREIERKNFKFKPIYFDYDKADIRPEYKPFLMDIVKIIDGHSDLRVLVTGNTDSDGSDKYNVELSKRRAQAIIDFFVANGLSQDKIEIQFNGESKPVDVNSTEEGKQKNRRVEFSFI